MRECQDCSTEIALDLLINQMHKIWNAENYVIFLLTLNITKIYDRTIYKYFIYVLKAKKISVRMINWIYFFMTDQIIILILANYKIKKTSISIKILQESFLSFILYLFYVIELLETCNNINDKFSINNFINNINLLTYSSFIKWNCCMLMRVHEKCLN